MNCEYAVETDPYTEHDGGMNGSSSSRSSGINIADADLETVSHSDRFNCFL